MGQGRKPTPTALKLVKGNPGKRALPKNEPKPKRMIPSPPEHLSERARTAWGSLSTRLDRLGILTELDAHALEQLCENYAEIIDLRADIAASGRFQTVTTQSGDKMERVRPVTTQLNDAERRFKGMMAEFGLTPSSRTKVQVDPEGNDRSDPAEAYF